MTDYDRILVLDNGRVVEYDSPLVLFYKEGGIFRSMCEKSADWQELEGMLVGHNLHGETM